MNRYGFMEKPDGFPMRFAIPAARSTRDALHITCLREPKRWTGDHVLNRPLCPADYQVTARIPVQ
jgi:hypothetical protein